MLKADLNSDNCFSGFLWMEHPRDSNSFSRKFFKLDLVKKNLFFYSENLYNHTLTFEGGFDLTFLSLTGNGDSLRPKVINCFYIVISGVRHFLKAENEEDKKNWMNKLKQVASIEVPRNELNYEENLNEGFKVELVAGVVVKTQLDPSNDQEINNETNMKNKNEDADDTIFINKSVKDNDFVDSPHKNRNILETPLLNENIPSYNNAKERINSDLGETNCCMIKGIYKDSSTESSLFGKGNKEVMSDNESKEVVFRSGYLIKQGYHVKTWKTRHFRLTKNSLNYYKLESDALAIRKIMLDNVICVRHSYGIHLNKAHLFEVVTRERVFYIQAKNDEEKESWMNDINNCLSNLKAHSVC